VLNPSRLALVDFPDRYLLPGTFTDIMEVSGETLRHSLQAGDPLLRSALLAPGEAGIADGLEEGFRAFPLPASAVSFPAGELWKGSRVDILAVEQGAGRLVLENIEILGISGLCEACATAEDDLSYSEPYVDGECIMLQLTPEESCRLAAALEEGKVELVLRPSRGM
ncbi:MAG: Flp pilus assembly protein CpaB, partial [Actinomycetota bacterium]